MSGHIFDHFMFRIKLNLVLTLEIKRPPSGNFYGTLFSKSVLLYLVKKNIVNWFVYSTFYQKDFAIFLRDRLNFTIPPPDRLANFAFFPRPIEEFRIFLWNRLKKFRYFLSRLTTNFTFFSHDYDDFCNILSRNRLANFAMFHFYLLVIFAFFFL